MVRNEIDLKILTLFAKEFSGVSRKAALVGDVNKNWSEVGTIHLIVLPRSRGEYQLVMGSDEDVTEKFQLLKKEFEDFSYNQELQSWHQLNPGISIIIEKVTREEFAFKELKYNSPDDFYQATINHLTSLDYVIDEDWRIYDTPAWKEERVENERELLELAFGYYFPINLRDKDKIAW